ncbi:hypothetical protein C0993_000307, partial [Termitomyces sp. T159_Od127]
MSDKDLKLLALYLHSLPNDLRQYEPENSLFKGFALDRFSLDAGMIKEEGKEHAVNAAIEGALWGITRNKDDGTFEISEQKSQNEALQSKMLLLNSQSGSKTKIVFQKYNKPLPILHETQQDHDFTDLSSIQIRNSKAKRKGFLSKKSKAAIPKKQDSKIFMDIKDGRYNDQPEKIKPLEPMEKKSVSASSLHEGRKKLKKEGDNALVELLASCGLSTHLASNPYFRRFSDAIS